MCATNLKSKWRLERFKPHLVYIYIYIYIYIYHHHHVMLLARILLTLSLTIPLYYPSLPVSLLDFIRSPYWADVDNFYMVVKISHVSMKRVHSITSLMSSFLLLQQWPAWLVRLIWMVLELGDSWPYSCCFAGCCSRICSLYLVVFLSNTHQGFSQSAKSTSMQCIHIGYDRC